MQNYMLNDTYFVKAGVAFVELNTEESLGTGSKYGNEDIYGGVIGLGAKSDNHRFELIFTGLRRYLFNIFCSENWL